MMMTTTTAPIAPAPTSAPAPVVPPPPALAPVAASRRSVLLLLAAAVGGLAVACLLYVLVDRPGLREPLEAAATVVAAAAGVAGFVWGISRATRVRALNERGMSWKSVWTTKPDRDITPDEASVIAALPSSELGTEVMRLVDDQKVTQSSIAAVLGMHRSQLNTKIQGYRKTGRWPMRAVRENGFLPSQSARRSGAVSPHAVSGETPVPQ